MLDTITWRKCPRDLLTNENFTYIESKLAPELSAAPYMFYLTMLKLVDDDGICDLGDGIIFSKLMRIGTPHDVFKIANLMQIQRIITRVSAESNLIFLNDWDYTKNTKPRTMEERRQIVLRLTEERKKTAVKAESLFSVNDIKKATDETYSKAELFNLPANMQEEKQDEIITLDFSNNPASRADFFCPKTDKNVENVVIKNDDDKNVENVVKKNQTERERERESIETDKETHTQATGFRADCEALQPYAKETAVAENEKETANKNSDTEINNNPAVSEINTVSDSESESEDVNNEEDTVAGILQAFFVKNCYGYKPSTGQKAINELEKRIIALSNDVNPPEVIANVLLKEFLKMHNSQGHWKDVPLLPAYMKKEGVWAHLMNFAGKVLAANQQTKKIFDEQAAYYAAVDDEERANVYNALKSEYLKYNIDPQDPNRFVKLAQAKKGGTEG